MRQRRQPVLCDGDIVTLYWDRNESAICETDKKYGHFLYTVAHNILADRGDSEECQNDTYLRTWDSIPPAKPENFKAFLSRITRNLAINRYKEKHRQKRVTSHFTASVEELTYLLQGEENVEREVAAAELGRMLNAYVHGLTERQRYIFMGRYYFALPVSQIAKELGISASAVSQQLNTIKAGLKAYLEERGETV